MEASGIAAAFSTLAIVLANALFGAAQVDGHRVAVLRGLGVAAQQPAVAPDEPAAAAFPRTSFPGQPLLPPDPDGPPLEESATPGHVLASLW